MTLFLGVRDKNQHIIFVLLSSLDGISIIMSIKCFSSSLCIYAGSIMIISIITQYIYSITDDTEEYYQYIYVYKSCKRVRALHTHSRSLSLLVNSRRAQNHHHHQQSIFLSLSHTHNKKK